MKLRLHQFELPLKHVFTIARNSMTVQTSLVVELEENGVVGYGEATTDAYYNATIERMTASLRSIESELEQITLDTPSALWKQFAPQLSPNPFAQCALDQAAHDLWGKKIGKPVYELWGLDIAKSPQSDMTIGIDSVAKMVEKLKEVPGWPIYKIKLGTKEDVKIITELRKQTDAVFRVDANCGWGVDEAVKNSELLKPLGVEFIEQPLPREDWDGVADLYKRTALPIIADESCISEEDVARCHGNFHGVNIKLMKCGGMTPARRMIENARKLSLQVMIGCMSESTVGISAIAQLLPLLDYVDMDGAELIAEDIATGAYLDYGTCYYSKIPGNGVMLEKSNALAQSVYRFN